MTEEKLTEEYHIPNYEDILKMKMEPLDPDKDHRQNLLKYYKFIVVCKLCRKEYGIDKRGKKHDSGICHICSWGGGKL